MTLLSYQVFKTVVEQGSFQKASEVLGITPSAVSHAVASMENELSTSLFIRSKSGITLTSFGRNLLPYVNAVLTSDQTLQQAISEFSGMKSGKVTLGTFSSACTNWVPDILQPCQEAGLLAVSQTCRKSDRYPGQVVQKAKQ